MYTKKARVDRDIIHGLYKQVCTSQPNEQADTGKVRKREVSTSGSSASRNCVLIKSVESNVHTYTYGLQHQQQAPQMCHVHFVRFRISCWNFLVLHCAGFKTIQVEHALETTKTAKLDSQIVGKRH